DQGHALRPGALVRAGGVAEGSDRVHGQAPPPLAFDLLTTPLTMTVSTRWFCGGALVGMHTVIVAWLSIWPDGRNTIPAAGPLTCTLPEAVVSRMTSTVPVTLSRPRMIQRDQP